MFVVWKQLQLRSEGYLTQDTDCKEEMVFLLLMPELL